MRALLIQWLDAVLDSYWLVPSCMLLLAAALATVLPWLDREVLGGATDWLGWGGIDSARAVVVTVGGSIVGVGGAIFSIAIVAVSYASGQFGPRLINNFMRDRGNQFTLGVFVATFVYCLLLLRVVDAESEVPRLAVTTAMLLALASAGAMIYFFHHVPETINIDRLVAGIGRRLAEEVLAPFPESGPGAERDGTAERGEGREPEARAAQPMPRGRMRILSRLSSSAASR